jgi:hypothetical protein
VAFCAEDQNPPASKFWQTAKRALVDGPPQRTARVEPSAAQKTARVEPATTQKTARIEPSTQRAIRFEPPVAVVGTSRLGSPPQPGVLLGEADEDMQGSGVLLLGPADRQSSGEPRRLDSAGSYSGSDSSSDDSESRSDSEFDGESLNSAIP